MLTIASAIVEHSLRIMFFRHDGRGLPAKRGSTLYLLMLAAVLARVLRDTLDPSGFDVGSSALGCLIYLAVLHVVFRPSSMAALLLASLFTYVLTAALYQFGIANGYVTAGIWTWEAFAVMVVLHRQVQRAKGDHNNPTSGKK